MPHRLTGVLAGRPLSFLLPEGRSVIGSAAGCGILLAHASVSRTHAEIVVSGETVELGDLGSRNGTFVDGRRVQRETLTAGAEVSFGRVRLRLVGVDSRDLEVGVPFGGSAPATERRRPGPDGARSTLATSPLATFAVDHLPGLLRRLTEGAGSAELAAAVGASLATALQVPHLEVRSRQRQGVLFRHGEGPAPAGAAARVTSGDTEIEAVFLHEGAALMVRPVLESGALLIELAGPRSHGAAPASPRPPAMPDPPSLVPAVLALHADTAKVARGDVGILIGGESGTGKEVLARYVHAASPRSSGRFVALNCAALPRDLLEAELFGIEKGVATGVEARAGRFEQADGGTLFLDEVGDMAAETQARLLRVLQEKEVYRVGGTTPRRADARIVAATNKDMRALIETGAFREDLYYRIATWTVEMPPLRHRKADIPNLAAFFLQREAARRGVRAAGISRAALDALVACAWPGNVRQLEKEMARAALFLEDGDLLETSRLSPFVTAGRAAKGSSLAETLEATERREILAALASAGGDVVEAARLLGLGRSTLYRRIKELALDQADARRPKADD